MTLLCNRTVSYTLVLPPSIAPLSRSWAPREVGRTSKCAKEYVGLRERGRVRGSGVGLRERSTTARCIGVCTWGSWYGPSSLVRAVRCSSGPKVNRRFASVRSGRKMLSNFVLQLSYDVPPPSMALVCMALRKVEPRARRPLTQRFLPRELPSRPRGALAGRGRGLTNGASA